MSRKRRRRAGFSKRLLRHRPAEMKYAIMSDAHSNPAALDLALRDARRRKCERFVFLGDTTGYGYDVKSTLKLVRENFDAVILGNHDSVCSGAEDGDLIRINSHYDIDRSQGQVLSKGDIRWLRSLKHTYENDDFICAHGDFVDPAGWGYVIEPVEALGSFMSCRRDLMFCGHTHHACVWELVGKRLANRFEDRLGIPATRFETISFKLRKGVRYIINVGSVGYPRYDLCCSYAIYDSKTGRVAIRRLPFDFKGYIMNMIAAKIDHPQWLSEILMAASARARQ